MLGAVNLPDERAKMIKLQRLGHILISVRDLELSMRRSNAEPMPWPCQRSSVDRPNSKLAVSVTNP